MADTYYVGQAPAAGGDPASWQITLFLNSMTGEGVRLFRVRDEVVLGRTDCLGEAPFCLADRENNDRPARCLDRRYENILGSELRKSRKHVLSQV